VWILGGFPLRFRIAFPAIPGENNPLFFCLFSLAYDGLIASFARKKRGKGAKQQTFRFVKSKL